MKLWINYYILSIWGEYEIFIKMNIYQESLLKYGPIAFAQDNGIRVNLKKKKSTISRDDYKYIQNLYIFQYSYLYNVISIVKYSSYHSILYT